MARRCLAEGNWISARTMIDGIVHNSKHQRVESGAKQWSQYQQLEGNRHEIRKSRRKFWASAVVHNPEVPHDRRTWKLDRETNNQAGMLLRQEVLYGSLYRSGRMIRVR